MIRNLSTVTMLLVCWLCAPVSPVLAESTDSEPDEKTIEKLVSELDSDDFSVREQATRKLAEAGLSAIEPLAQVAPSGSLEAATRAIAILEVIYTGNNEVAVDAAESALERLQRSANRSVAARAHNVLSLHYGVRERRAVAEFRKLGGIVKYAGNRGVAVPVAPNANRSPILAVVLSLNWKGGDEGLKYIKRLRIPPPQRLTLFRIVGSRVSDAAVQDLENAMPQLNVEMRGPAFLGIRAAQIQTGCRITQVDRGTAAHKAGLRPGDLITKFAGEAVPDFLTLIDLIGTTKPGDKVKVIVRRKGREETREVVMSEWSE